MKAEALTDRFGAEGRRAWELSNGIDGRPLVPMKKEESIAEHLALPFASASLELLVKANGHPAEPGLRPARDAGSLRRRGGYGVRPVPRPSLAQRISSRPVSDCIRTGGVAMGPRNRIGLSCELRK